MSTLRNFQNEQRGKGANIEIKFIKMAKNDNNFKMAAALQPLKTWGSGTRSKRRLKIKKE